jgi:hypothetical protein
VAEHEHRRHCRLVHHWSGRQIFSKRRKGANDLDNSERQRELTLQLSSTFFFFDVLLLVAALSDGGVEAVPILPLKCKM